MKTQTELQEARQMIPVKVSTGSKTLMKSFRDPKHHLESLVPLINGVASFKNSDKNDGINQMKDPVARKYQDGTKPGAGRKPKQRLVDRFMSIRSHRKSLKKNPRQDHQDGHQKGAWKVL